MACMTTKKRPPVRGDAAGERLLHCKPAALITKGSNRRRKMQDIILQGDALSTLRTVPSDSIDMVITSPPYWGLRDYGVEGQLGQEPDFHDFITDLCDIFDEVQRVLKPAGTCWVNLGDSYGGRVGGAQGKNGQFAGRSVVTARIRHERPLPKSLLQIPSRFAIEMSARGWILRNEIIWHKPNIMPQSVKDRFTVDFEKLFFFTKSKSYHFEQQFDPARDWGTRNRSNFRGGTTDPHLKNHGLTNANFADAGKNKRSVWKIATRSFAGAHFATYPEALIETPILAGCPEGGIVLDPFMGSGTTGAVAHRLGRHYLGIELNSEYIAMAEKRIAKARAERTRLVSTLPLDAS